MFISHINSILDEDFYFEVTTNLNNRHGGTMSSREMLDSYHRLLQGIEYLTSRYTRWWTALKPEDRIDVGTVGKSPYDLVLKRSDNLGSYLEIDVAQECGFIPISLDSAIEKDALNTFWNAAILELQKDKSLRLRG